MEVDGVNPQAKKKTREMFKHVHILTTQTSRSVHGVSILGGPTISPVGGLAAAPSDNWLGIGSRHFARWLVGG